MAFVSPLPVAVAGTIRPLRNGIRNSAPGAARTVAVLDKPAANPHLKEVSAGIMRDFLTRRAVHTVLYYYREMRDSAAINWLLNFERFDIREKNDMFHDGDEFLLSMYAQPPVKGFYVQKHPRAYMTRKFPFTIRPAQVADSILHSRKQLAEEWAVDLRCIESDNLELQRMSFERIVEKDPRKLDARRNLVFDSDVFESNQSPLRHKNWNKLVVLVTQHALTRLMPYLRDTSNHDYMYLLNFVSRYGSLSDGDAFVEELLTKPPVERTNPTYTVNPRALAVQILDLRAEIADEWIVHMKNVPDEQLKLSRTALSRSVKLPSEDDK